MILKFHSRKNDCVVNRCKDKYFWPQLSSLIRLSIKNSAVTQVWQVTNEDFGQCFRSTGDFHLMQEPELMLSEFFLPSRCRFHPRASSRLVGSKIYQLNGLSLTLTNSRNQRSLVDRRSYDVQSQNIDNQDPDSKNQIS